MKKSLLFVIDSLSIGGAEKSLISLLNLINTNKYDIDLLLVKSGGDLEKHLPLYVNVLPELNFFISKKFEIKTLYYRIKTSINLRINNFRRNRLHSEQVVFNCIDNLIRPIEKNYDVAIAYSQGMPTYLVANKIKAFKKFAWINTDYAETLYNQEFDLKFYCKMDKIIAVSEHIQNSVSLLKREYMGKVELVLDIIDPKMIYNLSSGIEVPEFDESITNILTVGRLVAAKGYDKAIEVANLLKYNGYKFKWFVIGDGDERTKLERKIKEYQLQNDFVLLGRKLNPYPYMNRCDIYVQTSIKEGFGLTVSEAKIMKRPIVCTKFPTAMEIINHNVDGLIVEHDIESIYNGVKKYFDDDMFRKKIINNLNDLAPYNSLNQLDKFYKLIN